MKKSLKGLVMSMCMLCSVSSVQALVKPISLATDQHIKIVPYQENNVVSFYGQTFVNTQIVFGNDETIIDYQSGDPDAWSASYNSKTPNILYFKPTVDGSSTNLSVITEDTSGKERRYTFAITSGSGLSKQPGQVKKQNNTAIYVLQFSYPEKQRLEIENKLNYSRMQKKAIINSSVNPSSYNWNYSFSGTGSIMPLHVFDDGKFTYMQIRDNTDMPAIFAVNNKKGEESVVNYRRQGNYIVVQQVAPQFTLRDGHNRVASIFNNPLIKKYRKED